MERIASGANVLLTGVGREGQVGETVARAFAEAGARVFAVDLAAADVQARAVALRAAGHAAAGYAADLTNEESVRALADSVGRDTGGALDALVCLAGGFAMSGPVAESSLDVWHRQFAINVVTAVLATRAFLPMLRVRRGAIVYFASAAALPNGQAAEMSAYTAAKSALLALMRAVAQEERAAGVRANALAPTAIRTAANLREMGDRTHYVEREQIADSVLFLCSPAASAVTGQVLPLG